MVEHPTMGCLLSAKLDWHDSDLGNKFSRQQQALKLSTKLWAQCGEDIDAYPSKVFSTKLRVPGAGDVLQLRYEGEPGKPFKFLGVNTSFIVHTEK